MPHANNLDLAVFPSMSKRHSQLLSNYGGASMASADEIWKAASSVWKSLPSCVIAKGFMHYNRILAKVIEHKGYNTFLQTAEFHTGVRTDYEKTPTGVKKVGT